MSAVLELELLARELSELQRRVFELRRRWAAERPSVAGDGVFPLLLCDVGEHRVALPLEAIDEVALLCRLDAVPGAPPGVVGLLNLRGTAVPVLDLRRRLFRLEQAPALSDLIVLCRTEEGRRAGLLVQGVLDLLTVEAGQVQPAGGELPHEPLVLGTIVSDDRQVWVLSVSRLLSGTGTDAA